MTCIFIFDSHDKPGKCEDAREQVKKLFSFEKRKDKIIKEVAI